MKTSVTISSQGFPLANGIFPLLPGLREKYAIMGPTFEMGGLFFPLPLKYLSFQYHLHESGRDNGQVSLSHTMTEPETAQIRILTSVRGGHVHESALWGRKANPPGFPNTP